MLSFKSTLIHISLLILFLSKSVSAQINYKKKQPKIACDTISFDLNSRNLGIISNSKINHRIVTGIDSITNFTGQNLRLKINTIKDVKIILDKNSTVNSIDVDLVRVHSLIIKSYYRYRLNMRLLPNRKDLNAHTVQIRNAKVAVNLKASKIENLIFKNCEISYLNLSDAQVTKSLEFHTSRLDSACFRFALLPNYISFDSVNLERASKINMKDLLGAVDEQGRPVKDLERTLGILKTDLDKLDLPYDRFNFHILHSPDIKDEIWIYEKLLKHLQDAGLNNNYDYYKGHYIDILDKQNHSWLHNNLNIFWWKKGQNKSLTVYISFEVFFALVFINWLFCKHLTQVYYPSTFKRYFDALTDWKTSHQNSNNLFSIDWIKFHLKQVIGVGLYTAFIFWGWRLDIHDLKLHRPFIALYIIFQFVLGLLFLAYIINWIVVR